MRRITPEACRAGRALLGWSMRDLASSARVSLAAVMRLEAGAGTSQARTIERIEASFAAHGVELILQRTKSGATIAHQALSTGGVDGTL